MALVRVPARLLLSAAAMLAVVLVALAATGPAPARGATADPAPAPARLFVVSDEWSLVLSRLTVKAGPVIVQLSNQGEDAHDLHLRRIGARGARRSAPKAIATTSSGRLTEAELKLRPGRWRLWCSLPGHKEAGMRATLRAK